MTLITFYFAPSDAYLRGVIRGETSVYPKRIQRVIVEDRWVYLDRLIGAMARYCQANGLAYGGCEHRYAPSLDIAWAMWKEEDRKRQEHTIKPVQAVWICPYCDGLSESIPLDRCPVCNHFLTKRQIESGIQLPKE